MSLKDVFVRNWDKPFLLDARANEGTDAQVTYGDFLGRVTRLIAHLESQGIKKDDRILIALENGIEMAAFYFAGLVKGFCLVPINIQNESSFFELVCEKIKIDMVVVEADIAESLKDKALGVEPSRCHFLKRDGEAKSGSYSPFDFDFSTGSELSSSLDGLDWDEEGNFEKDLLVIFSSGTSGVPKAIQIGQRQLIGNGRLFIKELGLKGSRFYNVLPMTYLGGTYNLLLIPFLAEGSTVLDDPFGPTNIFDFWDSVARFEIQTLWFNATMIAMLSSLPEDRDPDSINVGTTLCGMAPLSIELKKKFEKRFDVTLLENFALSETLFLTSNRMGLSQKDGSNGTVLEGVQVKIVDENRKELPAESEGEILAVTPYLMNDYLLAEPSDREKIVEEGFLTGDIGKFDENGELFITGRKKEIIIRGGINIGPKSIENVIYRVDGVMEAAVVGVPHDTFGEEVEAAITVKDNFEATNVVSELKTLCKKEIAFFKRPKKFHVLPDIPKGKTGKILKRAVIEQIARR